MKIAIIGAGLSGLSCAIELKQNGIDADVYEKNSMIGDNANYNAIRLNIFEGENNYLKKLNEKYNLELKPLYSIKKMHIYSKNSSTLIKGNLGNVFTRGTVNSSIENQLSHNQKLNILYESFISVNSIKDKYDFIVAASGNCEISKELGLWNPIIRGCVRIASITGHFKTGEIIIWFDTSIAKHGFGYFVPSDEKSACLVLAVNDITFNEINYYWEKFEQKIKFDYSITEMRDLEHEAGSVLSLKSENIYLTGNAGGFIDSFIGFGLYSSIESGFLAARSIITGQDYQKLTDRILKKILTINKYKTMISSFTDKNYDKFVRLIGVPIIQTIIYKNPFFYASNPSVANLIYHIYSD